jgi:hypothetical protein
MFVGPQLPELAPIGMVVSKPAGKGISTISLVDKTIPPV